MQRSVQHRARELHCYLKCLTTLWNISVSLQRNPSFFFTFGFILSVFESSRSHSRRSLTLASRELRLSFIEPSMKEYIDRQTALNSWGENTWERWRSLFLHVHCSWSSANSVTVHNCPILDGSIDNTHPLKPSGPYRTTAVHRQSMAELI